MKDLVVSEMFYSIQGEGFTTGVPAVFLRTASCNLTCRGWSFQNAAGEILGCDTTDVWKTGTPLSIDTLLLMFEDRGYINHFKQKAHLILTGGEPLLRQNELLHFLIALRTAIHFLPHIEIETNGTIVPDALLHHLVSQYNVSPKLVSGGDPEEKRYKPAALEFFSRSHRSFFKFVISREEDVQEVFDKYITPFKLTHDRVCFMPEGGTSERLKETSPMVAELCKKYRVRYSDRLQVRIWEKTTGV